MPEPPGVPRGGGTLGPPAPHPPAVDAHAHLVGLDRDSHGCLLGERMRRRISTRFVLRMVGARLSDPPLDVDRRCVDHLHAHLDGAPSVDRVVLLALDGIHGRDGRLDERRTSLMVPNDYVHGVAAGHPKLLFGCSVHPYRADALEELDRCADRGAVLVKWIPAAQGIDPSDPALAPFYARMRERGLPLLSHVGTEMAVTTVDASLGAFDRLLPALEAGVRVIVPHAGGRRLIGDEADWRRLVAAMERHPGLHVDDSALAMLHRRRRLLRVLETPSIHDRVLHGSDFPLPSQAWAFADRIGLSRARAVASIPSAFEKDVALKDALGAPRSFLGNAARVLRMPGTSGAGRGLASRAPGVEPTKPRSTPP